MKFKYKAKRNTGDIYSSVRDAKDKMDLFRLVREQGDTVIEASEVKGFNESFEQFASHFGSIKMHEKIIFARNLSAMLQAGLPLSRALSVLERQIKNPKFKKVFITLQDEINKGSNLSQAMQKFPKVFSNLFVSMVAAGEGSGSLGASLNVVSSQMEKTYTLQKKVKGAMIYPAVILSVMLIIGALMLIFVVPNLTATFKEAKMELPVPTQVVIFLSDFMTDHYLVALVIVVLVVVGGSLFFNRTKAGKQTFDFIALHAPGIANLVKETNSARTTRTLSSLLSSGVQVVEAVKITRDVVQNSYYKKVLTLAEENIQKGIPMSKIFIDASDIYPIFVGEMISVGEETGRLAGMLLEVAVFYETEVEQVTKDMSTIIEPFLMVFIGGAVGFFAVAMISPIYSLSSSI